VVPAVVLIRPRPGLALLVALIVAWLVAIARGQSGSPYDWLLAIGGLAYLLAVAWFRWRG
jgi:hypothetical protein